MHMYLEADVDTSILADEKIAILGYGSQGRAHALNLKDSGFNVVVGLRKSGASWPQAEADGLTVAEPLDAAAGASVVMFLTPDMVQKSLYASVVDAIPKGALLLFATNGVFGEQPPKVARLAGIPAAAEKVLIGEAEYVALPKVGATPIIPPLLQSSRPLSLQLYSASMI